MVSVLFEGQRHKITTDGGTFFLYLKISRDDKTEIWELSSKNTFEKELFKEVLKALKKIISADLPEEEKISKIYEPGLFGLV